MRTAREIKGIIDHAAAYCRQEGLRFTAQRQKVLEIIATAARPIGAYDILAELGKSYDNPKPTTVYRALEFLQQHAFIHRIESLNAFVTCHAGHAHQGSQFTVCDLCGRVEEVHLCHVPADLEKKVSASGFHLAHWSAELHGVCRSCRTS